MPIVFYQMVGVSGLILLAIMTVRLLANGLFRFYPLFFTYICFVFVSSIISLWLRTARPATYSSFYWVSQVISILIGLGLMFEIMRNAFGSFPAVRAFSLIAFRILLLAIALRLLFRSAASFSNRLVELERDTRTLQAGLLIVLVFLTLYYLIPLNKNLVGIILGYGLFICCSVVNLALRSHLGGSFQTVWGFLQPLQYLACEAIWCTFLWNANELAFTHRPALGSAEGIPPVLVLERNLQRLQGYFAAMGRF